MEEMNKMWLAYQEKTCESFYWVEKFYSNLKWPNFSYLGRLSGQILENIHRRLFAYERDPEEKLVYTTRDYWKTLNIEEKRKVVIISMSVNNYTISKIDGAKFFVFEALFENGEKNFLKGLKSKRVEACLALAKSIKQKYIYEIELKDKGVDNKTEDFVLLEWRTTGWGGSFLIKNTIN